MLTVSEARQLQTDQMSGEAIRARNALTMTGESQIAADLDSRTFASLMYNVAEGKPATEVAAIASSLIKNLGTSYPQQMVIWMQQAHSLPGGVDLFAAILNEMIIQSACDHVLPLIHMLYHQSGVSINSLGNSEKALQSIAVRYPELSQCVLAGP